jgi:CDP-glucose 4,6-dehydratase
MLELASLKSQLTGPVLITGHTGFKGTWLTLLLEELGIQAVGFSLPPLEQSLYQRADRFGKIPEVFGDIRNLQLLRDTFERFNPTHVIHMAAAALVLKSYSTPIPTFETNVLGTANLLEVATQSNNVKVVACVTTDKVYENNNSYRKFHEADALRGKDPYSASKVASESVIDAWRNLSAHRNHAKVISLRSGNVIGGGDYSENRLMPDIIRKIFEHKPLLIRNLEATRPWQHVLDPLFGYLLAIDYSCSAINQVVESFNYGPSEESLSVREVIRICKEFLPELGNSSFNEWNSDTYEAERLQLDSTRANSLLGWRPRFSQEAAVVSTLSWWKNHLVFGLSGEELCKDEINKFLRGV